jgi:hypothetical protein
MAKKNAGERSPWVVPIIVALITTAGAVIVALLNRPQPQGPSGTTGNTVTIFNVASGRSYFSGELMVGATVYSDRDYVYSKIPSFLHGKTYIITANEDKFSTDTSFLRFSIAQDATVYVAHSDRYMDKPAWLLGFQDTGADLEYGVDSDIVTLSLYEKLFPAGQVVLGGNIPPGETANHAMYTVVITEN